MPDYYFPAYMLNAEESHAALDAGPFAVVQRRWQVNPLDIDTLASRHKVEFDYRLLPVFLSGCNVELRVSARQFSEAVVSAERFRAMLYLHGTAPFVFPYGSTHSINDYANISGRDTAFAHRMPKASLGLREGITSATATVEMWPIELTLGVAVPDLRPSISPEAFGSAIDDVNEWNSLLTRHKELAVVQDVLTIAPLIPNPAQSLLHIWTGIEALFPTVQQEVTFRVALYLAQLYTGTQSKREYFRNVRKAYDIRSKIAHGGMADADIAQWTAAWRILLEACLSVLHRGRLMKEEDIMAELFPQ